MGAQPARSSQPVRVPAPWVHTFVDVPADRFDGANVLVGGDRLATRSPTCGGLAEGSKSCARAP